MTYVSITGLEVKHALYVPIFWYHAIRSMMAAKSAHGVISAETRTINGVHHTLSVWQSKEHMLAYLRSPVHLKAMRVYKRIATGKTLGFEAETAPIWNEVHELWRSRGRVV